jgi:hypothetical protein
MDIVRTHLAALGQYPASIDPKEFAALAME